MSRIHLIMLAGAALTSVVVAAAIQPKTSLMSPGTRAWSYGQAPSQVLGQIDAAMSR
jgi:hypothetical protein